MRGLDTALRRPLEALPSPSLRSASAPAASLGCWVCPPWNRPFCFPAEPTTIPDPSSSRGLSSGLSSRFERLEPHSHILNIQNGFSQNFLGWMGPLKLIQSNALQWVGTPSTTSGSSVWQKPDLTLSWIKGSTEIIHTEARILLISSITSPCVYFSLWTKKQHLFSGLTDRSVGKAGWCPAWFLSVYLAILCSLRLK